MSEPSDFAASAASVTAASVVFSAPAGAAVVAVAELWPPHPASPIVMAAAVTSAISLLFFIVFLLLLNSFCCPDSGRAANLIPPLRAGCKSHLFRVRLWLTLVCKCNTVFSFTQVHFIKNVMFDHKKYTCFRRFHRKK